MIGSLMGRTSMLTCAETHCRFLDAWKPKNLQCVSAYVNTALSKE